MRIGADKIPPVTLMLLATMLTLYYNPLALQLPTLGAVCLIPAAVVHAHAFSRLLTSVFFHADDMHVYYNMSSLLYKGLYLERRLGSLRFLLVTLLFIPLSTALHTLLATLLLHTSIQYGAAFRSCAVGFSGVLFAYKVVANHDAPGSDLIMGMIPVPSKHVYWAELLLISLISPNASFLGHLSGILAGLLYLHTPLRHVVERVAGLLTPRDLPSPRARYPRDNDPDPHPNPRPPRPYQNFGGRRLNPNPSPIHSPNPNLNPIANAASQPRYYFRAANEGSGEAGQVVREESPEERRQRLLLAAEARLASRR